MTLTEIDNDIRLEASIDAAEFKMRFAKTREELENAWTELRQLHAQRTAQQVARMEAAMGLSS